MRITSPRSSHPCRVLWVRILFAALLAAPAAARADGADARLLTAPPVGLQGDTGLLLVPTAEVLPYGVYAVGVDRVAKRYRYYPDPSGDTVAHFVSAGVLPQLEVTATFTNQDGKLGAQFREDLGYGFGGWNFDRMFSVQGVLIPQGRRFPLSIGGGMQDLGGTGYFRTQYLVATKRWAKLGLTVGSGTHRLGKSFWGIDVLPLPSLRLMLENDGYRTSFGATYQWRHFRITPYSIGLDTFQGGITYLQHI